MYKTVQEIISPPPYNINRTNSVIMNDCSVFIITFTHSNRKLNDEALISILLIHFSS